MTGAPQAVLLTVVLNLEFAALVEQFQAVYRPDWRDCRDLNGLTERLLGFERIAFAALDHDQTVDLMNCMEISVMRTIRIIKNNSLCRSCAKAAQSLAFRAGESDSRKSAGIRGAGTAWQDDAEYLDTCHRSGYLVEKGGR